MTPILVVGAGFAGATFARMAADDGRDVFVIDQRRHIGGNAADAVNEHGICYHRYGPHIFHTNAEPVWEFLSRFTSWRSYEHRVKALVNGVLVPMPINLETIQKLLDPTATAKNAQRILGDVALQAGPIANAEDAVTAKVGRHLYQCLYEGYTEKMWGMPASRLSPQVTNRIPVRLDHEDRYFTDRYQAIPKDGYTALFANLLDHPKIQVELDTPYTCVSGNRWEFICWTGPLDEFFDYRYRRLRYRSLRFDHVTLPAINVLPVATINYPGQEPFTRITEIKQITGQRSPKTTLTIEYPQDQGEPYYPIPSPVSQELARLYRMLAADPAIARHVLMIGRLGTYNYWNMDQVVAQAIHAYQVYANKERDNVESRSLDRRGPDQRIIELASRRARERP
jgi:UDP-galactopyranose mutase